MTSEPLEPRAGDVWMKDGDVVKVAALDGIGEYVHVLGFGLDDLWRMQTWREWSATATRVWPPEQREGDAISIEQICRDLLEQAVDDDLVAPIENRDPATYRFSAGDLCGAANLLQERIRQLKWNPPRPSPSTVRVRAAVFRDETGKWKVHGMEGADDSYWHEYRTVLAFIEADVPTTAAPTVEGRVES